MSRRLAACALLLLAPSTALAQARVTVVKPSKATVRKTTEQPGQVAAFETARIYAKIAGYVKSVAVDIGDRVKAGQMLAELEMPEAEAEVEQRVALVRQAKAERKQAERMVAVAAAVATSAEAHRVETTATLRRVEADATRWQAEYARTEQLARENTVTGSLRDETRSKLEAARAAVDEAKAHVRSAEADVGEAKARQEKSRADVDAAEAHVAVAEAEAKRAEAMLGYASLRAPFEGVVTRRAVDPGHLTVAGRAGAGDPLFVVERVDKLRVAVDVPETVAPLIDPGDRAEIRLQALDGKLVEAPVARVAWSLHESTRTLRAEIDLDRPDATFRPGLYARVTLVADERADVLTIPTAAVVRAGGKPYAVVVSGGQAHRRELTLGLNDGTRVEVRSGLGPEDDVAATAAVAEGLAEGQPAQAVPAEKPGAGPKKP